MNEIKKLIQKYENTSTKLEIDYLTNVSASTNNFDGLPKIHKSALISEAIAKQNNEYVEVLEPSDLKLRHIVAGPTCPTRPLIFYIRFLNHSFCMLKVMLEIT